MHSRKSAKSFNGNYFCSVLWELHGLQFRPPWLLIRKFVKQKENQKIAHFNVSNGP
jgi:hypothetical protein